MKKAQISLFIIVGIVILLVIGLVFFLRGQILKSGLESQAEKTAVVPLQLRPVKETIDNCVRDVSSQGLQIIGLQGGYLNLKKDSLPKGLFNQFSNSLEALPGLETAYWFYETNNGIQTSNVPSKEDIKNDLNAYVKENLDKCLTSLDDFRDQGYGVEFKDNIKVDANIEDQFVEVLVDYPVDINFKDVGKLVKKHYAKIDYPLGELYNSAVDILNSQNRQFYFENKTLDVLSVYSDIPYVGQSLNCVPRVWLKNDIEANLKNYIKVNINAIKVKGSLGSEVNPYFQFDIGKNYKNVDSNFLFSKDWPFELKINGGEDVLKEDSVIGAKNPATKLLVGLFCLNSYQFIYDIKYPVLVQLTKNSYTFQYAAQVIIKNNQPRANRLGVNNIEDQDTLFCKATPTDNTVYALNFDTGESLNDAEINVKCISTVCNVGKTSSSGSEALLNGKLPGCLNAEVMASKQGFNDGVAIANTNQAGTINIELKPKYTLNLEIKVIEDGVIRDLDSDENVIIQFSNEADNYNVAVNEDSASVELISGSYDLSSFLVVNKNNITLPGSSIEKCIDIPKAGILGIVGLKERKCFSTNIDSMNLDQIISGGDNFVLDLDKNKLSISKKIIVYVTKNNTPSNVEELKTIFDEINVNSKKPEFRIPELI